MFIGLIRITYKEHVFEFVLGLVYPARPSHQKSMAAASCFLAYVVENKEQDAAANAAAILMAASVCL
jgi:hypothetical protein